ncbi:hypothetical protein [Paractinoplanes atraurantiacus]|uniref:PPE family protein n=1 Tax=Paractinoplanes atraurantiacus TaxID=1036182 RepID=A0A285F463_9ACTN|nr:hypothetical protein [Actinoplanes atraurantiacus]SNY06055.1 hypothetical protein SAMN05421748_101617 [Actinoplanes atraurantiacus]
MLVADGGGGGGTNWYAMSVPDMQTRIQGPDTAKHYELLTGWKQSADLITEHRWQVQNYRDNLAAVWPPEKNEAAFAYLTRLDELIQNLDETYEAALANHDAFASATLSISLAQKDIQAIYDEYTNNSQLLTTFNAQQLQAQKADPGLTPTEKPPVADGRQEELRQKAAALLSTVSSDLALAQVSIRTPKLYQPSNKIDENNSPNDGTTYSAPPIPPITPAFVSDDESSRSSRPSITFPTTGPTSTGATPPGLTSPGLAPPAAASPSLSQQPGLILGGTNPQAPPPPITTPTPSPLPSGPSGPVTSPGLLPPVAGTPFTSGGTSTIPPTGTSPARSTNLPRESLVRPGSAGTGGVHVMPPGGLIGSTPTMGVGQPGGVRSGPARVNPVGGIIGGPNGPTGANGLRNQGIPPAGQSGNFGGPYGQAGGRTSARRSEPEDSRWDPDNPWVTAQGVDPVVMPPRDRKIDPGPAIGLD